MNSAYASNEEFLIIQKEKGLSKNRSVPETASAEYITIPNKVRDSLSSSQNFLLTPQNFPSKKGYDLFSDLIKDITFDGSVSKYLGMIDNDPHLCKCLVDLYDLEEGLGAEPRKQQTEFIFAPSLAIFMGTGDGTMINEFIEAKRPYNICIALRCWDDLRSSFKNIDWINLWNNYCQQENRSISFILYKSISDFRDQLFRGYLALLEHTPVLVPGPIANSDYLSDRFDIQEPHLTTHVNYLGFTIDEYNMLFNTCKSLSESPRLYSRPNSAIGGRYVICGSGPSLDSNIDNIKRLSQLGTHKIVACASNYRTLRSHSIDVDILCLLERGSYEYDNYSSVVNEFGAGNTKLFASSTCDERLLSLFRESMVFFRPGLIPLCIFSTNDDQVLYFDGPQTVNLGVGLCSALGAEECVLVGVDLGALSTDNVRSKSAVGFSDRTFDIQTPGNFEDSVFSSRLLMDGKEAMEKCILSHENVKYINSSNGVKIVGAEPMHLSDYLDNINTKIDNIDAFQKWWDESQNYSQSDLQNMWESVRPRVLVSQSVDSVVSTLLSEKQWFTEALYEIQKYCAINDSVRNQVGRRLIRSLVVKMALTISRQCYMLLSQDKSGELCSKFLPQARFQLATLCEMSNQKSMIYSILSRVPFFKQSFRK